MSVVLRPAVRICCYLAASVSCATVVMASLCILRQRHECADPREMTLVTPQGPVGRSTFHDEDLGEVVDLS